MSSAFVDDVVVGDDVAVGRDEEARAGATSASGPAGRPSVAIAAVLPLSAGTMSNGKFSKPGIAAAQRLDVDLRGHVDRHHRRRDPLEDVGEGLRRAGRRREDRRGRRLDQAAAVRRGQAAGSLIPRRPWRRRRRRRRARAPTTNAVLLTAICRCSSSWTSRKGSRTPDTFKAGCQRAPRSSSYLSVIAGLFLAAQLCGATVSTRLLRRQRCRAPLLLRGRELAAPARRAGAATSSAAAPSGHHQQRPDPQHRVAQRGLGVSSTNWP